MIGRGERAADVSGRGEKVFLSLELLFSLTFLKFLSLERGPPYFMFQEPRRVWFDKFS